MLRLRVFCGAGLLLLAGCAMTAITSEVDDEQGVVYYLPKSLLTLTVKQNYYDQEELEIRKLQFDTWSKKLPPEIVPGSLRTDDKSPPTKWFATFARMTVSYEISGVSQSAPDLTQRYVLKYQPNALFHDRLCIGRDASGLLQIVEYAGDDRTPEIAFNITRSLLAFTRTGAEDEVIVVGPLGFSRKLVTRTIQGQIDPWRLVYLEDGRSRKNKVFFTNPDLEAFNDRLNRELLQDGRRTERVLVNIDETVNALWAPLARRIEERCGNDQKCRAKATTELRAARCKREDVCYRTSVKVPVELTGDGNVVKSTAYVDIVNPYDVGSVNVERAFLVEKVTKVYFNSGALVGVAIRKPSQVEAATLFPINAITAAISAPVGLVGSAFGGNVQTQVALAKNIADLNTGAEKFKAQTPQVSFGRVQEDTALFQISCRKLDKSYFQ